MFKTFKEKFLLIWVLGIVLYLPLMNPFNAWYDEQYSLYLTSLSWKDMFHAIMTEDSHPPIHYILLRLWMMGMDWHAVGWARLMNLVILSLMALLGAFPIRRLAGDRVALWFTGLTFLFPTSLWLATNMRMYALMGLEITAFITYALLILKEGKNRDWMLFGFWGITLPYTHYFGCFTLAFVNISLFFAFLYQRKNIRNNLIKLFVCAGMTAIAFMPWFLGVMLKQASYMYDLWFPILSSAIKTLNILFVPFLNRNGLFIVMLTEVFMALCWLLMVQYAFDKHNKGKRFWVFLPTALFFEILITGLVLSIVYRPILVWWYMTPFMGGVVLALAIILAQEERFKKIFILLGLICFCGMYTGLYSVIHAPLYYQIQQAIRKDYSPKDTVFLCGNMVDGMMIQFYLPEYTWQRVPRKAELAIPKDLMYRQSVDAEYLKGKNILYLTSEQVCQTPMEDKYDHFGKLCLIKLSEPDAKKMVANSEKIIYNETH